MQVLFSSAAFFFDPLLALGVAAMCRACWGVFSLVTSFYGNDGAKFPKRLNREHARQPCLEQKQATDALSSLGNHFAS
jgi:hypothetical protein